MFQRPLRATKFNFLDLVAASATRMSVDDADRLAGLEYHGIPGATHPCEDAVVRLLQSRVSIASARILSCMNEHTVEHALLLATAVGDEILIKAGFGSGYSGTGPHGFSYILALLEFHEVEIDECHISAEMMERSHRSALTNSDLDEIHEARAKPPRLSDYVSDRDFESIRAGTLWRNAPPIVPFGVIDPRLTDLAVSFWASPDDRLRKGYARLEDIIRDRTGLKGHGSNLFSDAFLKDTAPLTWDCPDKGEIIGRANLFIGAAMAHRNPRAHRDVKTPGTEALSELLLLNHLYRLETEAIAVTP